jgi:two-component sensor histidine kinase/ligand-binding sensor domain-containing protein
MRQSIIGLLMLLILIILASNTVDKLKWKFFSQNPKQETPATKVQSTQLKRAEKIQQERIFVADQYDFNTLNFRLNSDYSKFKVKVLTDSNQLTYPEPGFFPSLYRKDVHSDNIEYCDKAHGLFSNAITTLLEDSSGYFWFGSEDEGLCLTNGSKVWVFNKENGLPSSSIKQIYQDKRGWIWIAWDTGVSYLKDGLLFHVKNSEVRTSTIQRIREDGNGAIWLCTKSAGVFKIDDTGELELLNEDRGLPGHDIKDVGFGRKGEVYLSCTNDGLLILNGLNGVQIIDKDLVGIRFAPISILIDGDRIWMGSYFGSNFYFENGKLLRFNLRSGYERCFKILKNEYGIWFADYGFGVLLIRKDGKIRNYGAKNGLTDRNALDIVFDHNANIWVADPFGGISMLRVTPFSMKAWPIVYPTSIQKINENHVWISSNGNGLIEVKNSTAYWHNVIPDKEDLTLDHSWDFVLNEDGTVWSSSHGLGVAEMKKGKMTYYRFQDGNVINDLTKDSNGNVWFATNSIGLRKWERETNQFFLFTKKDGLSSNNVRSTFVDDLGRLWICTDEGVDLLYKNKISRLNTSNGLCSNDINRVYQARDNSVWVASYDAGISIVNKDGIRNLNTTSGLISNRVIGIKESKEGVVWVSTGLGLSRIKRENNGKETITKYGTSYGAFMLDFTTAIESFNDGRVLFGNSKGIVEYDPYFEERREGSPRFLFEGMSCNTVKIFSTKRSRPRIKRGDDVQCDFSVMHWGRMEGLSVYYALVKTRNEEIKRWIKIPTNQKFNLNTRIDRGEYKLVFKVCTGNRSYFFSGSSFRLDIPWYDTWWFYLILFLFFMGLFLLVLRLRIDFLKRRKSELEQLVLRRTLELKREKEELFKANERIGQKIKEKDVLLSEMHHRVKNNLQTISSLLDMQLRTVRDEFGAKVLRESVRRISAMSASHELLYSNQEDLTNVDLGAFIKDLVSSQRAMLLESLPSPKIQYELESVTVNVSDAISIGMILSEAISNSIKHAFEGVDNPEITIGLRKKTEVAVLTISDNGVGGLVLNGIENRKSLGLRLIQIFVQKINGRTEIESTSEGTKISVLF